MLMFLKAEFLFLHFSYYALMIFLMVLSVILLSMMMIATLNCRCDKKFDLRLELELASELKSDLWSGAGCDLLIFNPEKTQLVSPDQLKNQKCIQRIFGCFQQGI